MGEPLATVRLSQSDCIYATILSKITFESGCNLLWHVLKIVKVGSLAMLGCTFCKLQGLSLETILYMEKTSIF